MGKKHAQAQAAQYRARADEEVREAETRRQSAERERQLLTSYLGTEEQVAGTGRFSVDPNVLKYAQRYSVDERALSEIAAAGAGVKDQRDPFQQAGAVNLGQQYASQANDLLGQAEAAARAGDFTRADQLYQQAQQIISGVSPSAAGAFNLGGGEESNAAIRASSTEGRIVGRQLLTARELGDPNSKTSTELRGRLLDPGLAAVDENTRNAERAIAAERGGIEGQIRQQAASGGTGVNARAQLALESRAASQAALQRAVTYSEAGQIKAAMISQVNLYLNEFGKRMAEDSVALAQDWVNGTAGVRDVYQNNLDQLALFQAQLFEERSQFFAVLAEKRRDEAKRRSAYINEGIFGIGSGLLAGAALFGGSEKIGQSSGVQGSINTGGIGSNGVGVSSKVSDAAEGKSGLFSGGAGVAPAGSATGGASSGGKGGGLIGSILAFL